MPYSKKFLHRQSPTRLCIININRDEPGAAGQPTMSLRRGAWLAAGRHEAEYGAGFKVRSIAGGVAVVAFEKLANSAATRGMDVYQWGVYTGGTMRGLARHQGLRPSMGVRQL